MVPAMKPGISKPGFTPFPIIDNPALDRVGRLYGVDSCTTTIPNRQRRVSFHPTTKTHDGLEIPQANLERLVYGFFKKKPQVDFLMQLLAERREDALSALLINIRSVICRVVKSAKGKSPLLTRGGGRGIILMKQHLPHLQKLFHATALVHKECAKRIAFRKQIGLLPAI